MKEDMLSKKLKENTLKKVLALAPNLLAATPKTHASTRPQHHSARSIHSTHARLDQLTHAPAAASCPPPLHAPMIVLLVGYRLVFSNV